MPPPLVVTLENKLQKSMSSGPVMGKQMVSHTWWPNHQGWGRTRDLAELDHFGLYERDDQLPRDKIMDHRWRSNVTKDRSSSQKFGPLTSPPGKAELDDRKCFQEAWVGQVTKSVPSWASKQVRPTHYYDSMNWKLDKYGLTKRADYSLATKDRTRAMSFNLSKADRFDAPKLFGRDYTRSGSSCRLNHQSLRDADAKRDGWKSPSAKVSRFS
mmetsp:Transcript_55110/g.98350  ORF Transcript_55110/g.98350 Transcript_55110/m.98350 type:complete len:213 (-) Transcript_55110:53-691(-)